MGKESAPMVRFLDKFIAKNVLEDTGDNFLALDPERRFNLLSELSEGFDIPLAPTDKVRLSLIPEGKNFQLFIQEAYKIANDPECPTNVLQDILRRFPDLHLPTHRS